MASKLEDLTDQADQMLSELDRSEEEVETILRDLRDLEDEYDQNVGGSSRPELIAVSAALADLTDGTRRFNDTIADAKGGLRAWLDAHGASSGGSVGRVSPSSPASESSGSEIATQIASDDFFSLPSNQVGSSNEGNWQMESYPGPVVLFGANREGKPTAEASDVSQYGLGDCWLLAVLMAVASRRGEALTRRLENAGGEAFGVTLGCPEE